MSRQKDISVARDFSINPGPRYRDQGEWSGQQFREKLLAPALRDFDKVVVDLDGTNGYGSSFLDEAFGGLVRQHGMTAGEIFKKLAIKSERDLSYKLEAEDSIRQAVRS